ARLDEGSEVAAVAAGQGREGAQPVDELALLLVVHQAIPLRQLHPADANRRRRRVRVSPTLLRRVAGQRSEPTARCKPGGLGVTRATVSSFWDRVSPDSDGNVDGASQ